MSQTAPPRAAPDRHRPRRQEGGSPLARLVDDWVAAEIITPEQASRILARSGGTQLSGVEPVRMGAIAVEALGYLGGVVVVVGCGLLASLYWSDLSDTVQVALLAAVAVLLLGAGFAVPQRLGGLAVRLRSVMWAGTVAATVATLAVYTDQFWSRAAQEHQGLLVSGGAAVLAVALWAGHRVILQQVVMMVLAAVTAGIVIADFGSEESWPGTGVWAVGLVWLALGWAGMLRPDRLARALGAATMVVGAMITLGTDAGTVLMLLTAAGVVALAVLARDLALLVVGALGLLRGIPAAVDHWFPNSLVAALALLVVGAGLVGLAVWIARRPSPTRRADDH
ncbi:MAG TPA: DUF2157 domain-containing protein [Marmoricola sp.]|nr:DUF2157 domain-containing protein [Marmoricola sp.]